MSKPSRPCIFCNSTGLTKEHVFPEWMKAYLPRLSDGTKHTVRYHAPFGQFAAEKGRLQRPGAVSAQTLREVCRACNNGWMSALQNEAKPILIALLTDDWKSLSHADQIVLNRWCAMFTMVYEMADVRTAAIAPRERHRFFEDRSLPEGWRCYVGRYLGAREEPYAWHFGGPNDNIMASGVQCSTFTFGKAFIQTFSIAHDFRFTMPSYGIKPTIKQIHPIISRNVLRPTEGLDDHGALALLLQLRHIVGSEASRNFKPS